MTKPNPQSVPQELLAALHTAVERPIELVALDLDGTSLGPNGKVSARLKKAVATLKAGKVHVVLATGRMLDSALPFWNELGLDPGYLIAYNGCAVIRLPESRWEFRKLLPQAGARRIVEMGLAEGLLVQAYVDKELWISEDDERAQQYIRTHRIPGWVRPGREILGWPEPPIKLLFQDHPDRLRRFRRAIQSVAKSFGIRLFFSKDEYLECISQEAGKGPALAYVAGRLGVPAARVLAVGDNENDIDMLKWAGLGVAMGQAAPSVKAAAAAVTAPLNQDGAGLVLELLAERLTALSPATPNIRQEKSPRSGTSSGNSVPQP